MNAEQMSQADGDWIECRDCGVSFQLSPSERAFFLDRQLHLPRRCRECRRLRRQERQEGAS